MIYQKEKLKGLDPRMLKNLESALAEYEALPFDVIIVEGLRKITTQVAYYAQGRCVIAEVNELRIAAGLPYITTNDNIKITNCDGIIHRSAHQDGFAIDLAPYDDKAKKIIWNAPKEQWLEIGRIAKKYDFIWGGDWGATGHSLGWDTPHIEYRR